MVLQAKSTEILRLAPANPEPAAGLLTDFPYTHHECEFHPGDLFLGYTDGIFEATDPHGHMFGEQRLDATLAECRGLSCAQLVERLVQSVKDFSYRSAFEDDVCLVAIESAGPRNR